PSRSTSACSDRELWRSSGQARGASRCTWLRSSGRTEETNERGPGCSGPHGSSNDSFGERLPQGSHETGEFLLDRVLNETGIAELFDTGSEVACAQVDSPYAGESARTAERRL